MKAPPPPGSFDYVLEPLRDQRAPTIPPPPPPEHPGRPPRVHIEIEITERRAPRSASGSVLGSVIALIIWAVILCALFGCAAHAGQHAPANGPPSIVAARSGTCSRVVIEGHAMPCGGTLLDTLSDHGRHGFTFEVGGDLATFSSSGRPHYRFLTEVSRIDTFYAASTGERPVDGFCSYSLIKPTIAEIVCRVESDYGIITARFVTDGRPAKPIELAR